MSVLKLMITAVQAVCLWLYSNLSGLVVEWFLYVIVDWFAQKRLMECQYPYEKQMVWLYESVVLMILACIVWCSHFPFILLLYILATLAHTQTAFGEYSRMLWNWLQGHWDVCQEHSGIQNDYATVHESLPVPAFQAQPAVGNQLDMVSPEFRQRRSTVHTQTSNTDLGVLSTATFPAPVSNVGGSVSHGNTAWNYPSHPVAATALSAPISSRSDPVRQPAENVSNSAVPPTMTQPVGAWQQTKNIVQQAVQSVHAVFSSTSIAAHNTGRSTPCGLRNGSGENLCFLNAVLQSLARTPSLVDELVAVRSTRSFSSAVVYRVADLFQSMKNTSAGLFNQSLDSALFRHAASAQLGSYRLVVAPYSIQHQVQQDASEFLTWLLEHLHATLNETIPQTAAYQLPTNGYSYVTSGVTLRQFAKMSLIKLKAEFNGPVQSSTISRLREGAMHQIEKADGSDGRAYIGPMRAVSCLDRLQHSLVNNSLVEDLFCGQIVDARQCDDCRHVTVNTQTFRILIVPVPDSENATGVTALGKCLEAFGEVEQMWGQNGLDCDFCNQARLATVVRSQSDPTIHGAFSPLSSWQHNNHRAPIVSPIYRPVNRSPSSSDFLMPPLPDNRTSTPIPGAPRLPSTRMLTNCKRRSLLGHLPPVLVIQLRRFGYGANNMPIKLKNQVSVPLSGLSLTDLLLENVELKVGGRPVRAVTYELYAMCLHLGADSTSSGHYVAYARCDGSEQRTWFKFDDSHVESVNIDYELSTKVVRENVYLLFYHRTL